MRVKTMVTNGLLSNAASEQRAILGCFEVSDCTEHLLVESAGALQLWSKIPEDCLAFEVFSFPLP